MTAAPRPGGDGGRGGERRSYHVEQYGPIESAYRHHWRIRIDDNGKVRYYTDNGEPEDNLFVRDYKWIVEELETAYLAGRADEQDAGVHAGKGLVGTIQALQARVAVLEAALVDLEESRALHESAWRTWEEKYCALEAENAALRGAVEHIERITSNYRGSENPSESVYRVGLTVVRDELRRALAADLAREVDAP